LRNSSKADLSVNWRFSYWAWLTFKVVNWFKKNVDINIHSVHLFIKVPFRYLEHLEHLDSVRLGHVK